MVAIHFTYGGKKTLNLTHLLFKQPKPLNLILIMSWGKQEEPCMEVLVGDKN
jgi:hypothetical protein